MSRFNPAFWEIPTDSAALERVAVSDGIWYETETDRERRYAVKDFFGRVGPIVSTMIDSRLTRRQREIVQLYFYYGKTQEDIAAMLNLTQSTVSRHLFGTVRGGKKVGGAIPKLRKVIDQTDDPVISEALSCLAQNLSQPV